MAPTSTVRSKTQACGPRPGTLAILVAVLVVVLAPRVATAESLCRDLDNCPDRNQHGTWLEGYVDEIFVGADEGWGNPYARVSLKDPEIRDKDGESWIYFTDATIEEGWLTFRRHDGPVLSTLLTALSERKKVNIRVSSSKVRDGFNLLVYVVIKD